ncbi:hypothetical protein COBT_004013, partial [Conglomerata obtusa]
MSITSLSTQLITHTNKNLQSIFDEYKTNTKLYNHVLIRIQQLKCKVREDQTQARIDMIICKLLREQNTNCRIVKVYRGDKLLGVVGDNVIKPNIIFLKNNTEIVCNHEYDKGHYREYYFNYNCCRKNIEKIKE